MPSLSPLFNDDEYTVYVLNIYISDHTLTRSGTPDQTVNFIHDDDDECLRDDMFLSVLSLHFMLVVSSLCHERNIVHCYEPTLTPSILLVLVNFS